MEEDECNMRERDVGRVVGTSEWSPQIKLFLEVGPFESDTADKSDWITLSLSGLFIY